LATPVASETTAVALRYMKAVADRDIDAMAD
jgi:hypothetical protein